MWIRAGLGAGLLVLAVAIAHDLWRTAPQAPPSTWAEERADDPQSVLPLCAALPKISPEQLGLCAGYLKAVAHVMARNSVDGQRACIPRATTVGALRDMVVDFVGRNPALVKSLATDALVARALAAGFPCQR